MRGELGREAKVPEELLDGRHGERSGGLANLQDEREAGSIAKNDAW